MEDDKSSGFSEYLIALVAFLIVIISYLITIKPHEILRAISEYDGFIVTIEPSNDFKGFMVSGDYERLNFKVKDYKNYLKEDGVIFEGFLNVNESDALNDKARVSRNKDNKRDNEKISQKGSDKNKGNEKENKKVNEKENKKVNEKEKNRINKIKEKENAQKSKTHVSKERGLVNSNDNFLLMEDYLNFEGGQVLILDKEISFSDRVSMYFVLLELRIDNLLKDWVIWFILGIGALIDGVFTRKIAIIKEVLPNPFYYKIALWGFLITLACNVFTLCLVSSINVFNWMFNGSFLLLIFNLWLIIYWGSIGRSSNQNIV